jgi:hypothetical protein
MHSAIKPAFTQHAGHHAGRVDKTDGGFDIASNNKRPQEELPL